MKKNLNEIYRLSVSIFFINILFAFLLLVWVTDNDIHGLPKNTLDRYISLFYYGITNSLFNFMKTVWIEIYRTNTNIFNKTSNIKISSTNIKKNENSYFPGTELKKTDLPFLFTRLYR